ncbi:hypothetical protein [Intrasporangium calvum]|uniref:GntT/GntP/DsdX family permease n=1 Tax=Intrasporangium calvum TaxID=53358 RepID=UPI001F35D3BD|nr:hypothetical protein [Intrasporangium calvum]
MPPHPRTGGRGRPHGWRHRGDLAPRDSRRPRLVVRRRLPRQPAHGPALHRRGAHPSLRGAERRVGQALTDSLSDLGLSPSVQAFLIATALRVAQGSATVALTTTAGLISAQVAAEGLTDVQIAVLVFATAAGATVLSHLNDSGFWLVSRFFGMDEKTTLTTWTVTETTLGLAIFAIAALLWLVV